MLHQKRGTGNLDAIRMQVIFQMRWTGKVLKFQIIRAVFTLVLKQIMQVKPYRTESTSFRSTLVRCE